MKSLVCAIVIIGAVAAACRAPVKPALGPLVWIDAPLPGSQLPVSPYDVVSHANTPTGVASFELSVDGQVVKTDRLSSPQYGQPMAHIAQRWAPAAAGTYLISVRAADVAGVWSRPAEVRATFGEVPSTTPTRGGQ